jgi:hypothetical protein
VFIVSPLPEYGYAVGLDSRSSMQSQASAR